MNPSGGAIGSISAIATSSTHAWYVLQAKRHRERLAQRSLADIGVETYLPLIVQWPRPVVGNEVGPMFPGYLFVHTALEQSFSQISWTPGVKSFVSFGGGPISLDPSIIGYLRGREGADGVVKWADPVHEKSQVRIVQGPFRGLTAVVEQRLSARERVRVLMDILHRSTLVELPERWVAKA